MPFKKLTIGLEYREWEKLCEASWAEHRSPEEEAVHLLTTAMAERVSRKVVGEQAARNILSMTGESAA